MPVSPNAWLKVLKFLVLDAVGLQKDWQRLAREQLADFVAEHVPADVPVRQVVALGKPFHVVVELAAELECDLIVISTHGYTGLAHVLLGSTAVPCCLFGVYRPLKPPFPEVSDA